MRHLNLILCALVISGFSSEVAKGQSFDSNIDQDLRETVPEKFLSVEPEKIERKKKIIKVPQPDKIIFEKAKNIPDEKGVFLINNFKAVKKSNPNKLIRKRVKQAPITKEILEPSKVKISAALGVSENFDSNFFNSNNSDKRDEFFTVITPSLTIAVPLDKDNINQITARTSMSFTEHDQFEQADQNTWVTSAGFSHKLAKPQIGGSQSVSIGQFLITRYNDEFEDRIFTIHRTQIGFSHQGIPLNKQTCQSKKAKDFCFIGGYSLALRKQFFDRLEVLDSTAGVLNLSLSTVIPKHLNLLPGKIVLSGGLELTGTWYDDFGIQDRDDFTVGINGGLQWAPNNFVTFSASGGYTNHNSSIDPLEFEKIGLNGGLRFNVKLSGD